MAGMLHGVERMVLNPTARKTLLDDLRKQIEKIYKNDPGYMHTALAWVDRHPRSAALFQFRGGKFSYLNPQTSPIDARGAFRTDPEQAFTTGLGKWYPEIGVASGRHNPNVDVTDLDQQLRTMWHEIGHYGQTIPDTGATQQARAAWSNLDPTIEGDRLFAQKEIGARVTAANQLSEPFIPANRRISTALDEGLFADSEIIREYLEGLPGDTKLTVQRGRRDWTVDELLEYLNRAEMDDVTREGMAIVDNPQLYPPEGDPLSNLPISRSADPGDIAHQIQDETRYRKPPRFGKEGLIEWEEIKPKPVIEPEFTARTVPPTPIRGTLHDEFGDLIEGTPEPNIKLSKEQRAYWDEIARQLRLTGRK